MSKISFFPKTPGFGEWVRQCTKALRMLCRVAKPIFHCTDKHTFFRYVSTWQELENSEHLRKSDIQFQHLSAKIAIIRKYLFEFIQRNETLEKNSTSTLGF